MKVIKKGNTKPPTTGFAWDYDRVVSCTKCGAMFTLEPTDRVALTYEFLFGSVACIEFDCPECGAAIVVDENGYHVR